MHGAGHEFPPEQSVRAAVVAADRHAKVGDVPAVAGVHLRRLDGVDVDERALAEFFAALHCDIVLGDRPPELVSGVLDVLRADVEPDDERFLIFRLVKEEVLRPSRHQTAVALTDLSALVALPDDAMPLQINGDLIAAAMEVLRMCRSGAENRVEKCGRASVLAGNRQPEFGNRPPVTLLHVFWSNVVDLHQRIHQSHGCPFIMKSVIVSMCDAQTAGVPLPQIAKPGGVDTTCRAGVPCARPCVSMPDRQLPCGTTAAPRPNRRAA